MGKVVKFKNEYELYKYLEFLVVNSETDKEFIDRLKGIDSCVIGSVYGSKELLDIAKAIDGEKLRKRHKRLCEAYDKGLIIPDVAAHC